MEAALVSNAPPPSAFQGAIDEQDYGSIRSQERHYQKTEKNPAQAERGPSCSIKDAVIACTRLTIPNLNHCISHLLLNKLTLVTGGNVEDYKDLPHLKLSER